MNWSLFGFVFGIGSSVVMGVMMTAALVLGFDAIAHVVTVIVIGLIISLPICYVITKRIDAKWRRSETEDSTPATRV